MYYPFVLLSGLCIVCVLWMVFAFSLDFIFLFSFVLLFPLRQEMLLGMNRTAASGGAAGDGDGKSWKL